MDDAELDISNPEVFIVDPPSGGCSIDSFFDDLADVFGKDNAHQHACTHTHTCNPPGPDLAGHTHTCLHVHTKILSSAPFDETADPNSSPNKKRPCAGNREAVRKYRQKKKAHAVSLEDEVVHLRALTQQLTEQLTEQLQGKAALEAEVARLRCLLVDIRGRIEGELGAFPYQKPVKSRDLMPVMMMGGGGMLVVNPCNLRCDDDANCLQPGMPGKGGSESVGLDGHQGFGACEFANIECMGGSALGPKE